MMELALALAVGFALGYGVREWSPGSVAEHSAGSAARSVGRPNLPLLQGLDHRSAG